MKRCLILTGGKLSLAFAGSFLKEHKFEKVVAVDGGLEAAKELDIILGIISMSHFRSPDRQVEFFFPIS